MRLFGYFALILLTGFVPFPVDADDNGLVELPIPHADRPAIEEARRLGREIFSYDQAAWGATDFLAQRSLLEDPRLRGWIAQAAGDGIDVLWIGEETSGLRLFHRMKVIGRRVDEATFQSYPEGAPLDASQTAAFGARQTAARQQFMTCSKSYNSVVLPQPGGYAVFLLAATTEPDKVLMGGHHRFDVDGTGTAVLKATPMAGTCIVSDAGANAELIAVTRIGSQLPTPVDVFLSLQHNIGIVIVTKQGLTWSVQGDDIALYGPAK